ncbi:MAG TPA: hypothetical protein VN132_01570, partial [Bdellovibrio sp.]|nr:hypothetical protein [Bdellovibrio sp.]
RIFIQNIPVGGAETNRVLKYSTINANGSQTEIPISKEQSQNPTDTLIASLEGDGQITSKSMARKIYFQNGDDMSVVERNGHIYSFELAHDQKLFKCSGVDAASSINCSCK